MTTYKMRVAITDILWRIAERSSGFTLHQIRKHYGFSIEEFCKNYTIAKEAAEQGDMETVKQFFDLYC